MRLILLLFLLIAIVGCKEEASKSNDEPGAFNDLENKFHALTLPFSVADSNMQEVADTATIKRSLFRKFVPDTVFANQFGKDTSFTLKPIGKIDTKGKENYLVLFAKGKQRTGIYLLVFKDQKFSASMPLLESNKSETNESATIDQKLSIIINEEWYQKKEMMYKRTIYAYNNVGVFTTVLTETNVSPVLTANTVFNPIDTFASKNKYSGDYVKGKKNFLSIRDGSSPNEYRFFVHFVTDGEPPCGGDLRGSFKLTSANAGVYSEATDQCVMDFKFSKNKVQVIEQGTCGNYRGITCFFNDTYTRKAEKKASAKK